MLITFFTIDWSPLTSTNCPPNFHGETLLLPSPLPHHPSGPHTSWPYLFWVCPLPPAFGPPCSCCLLCENTPLPLLTFQNVCTAFAAFCAVFAIFLLLLDAGFFLLCAVVLAVRVAVYGVAFVAAASCSFAVFAALLLLLLLRALSGRRPLKSQSLPAFDLPKCFAVIYAAVLLLFGTICAAACAACCCLCGLLLLLLFLFLLALSRFLLFVLLLLPLLGRRPLKTPPLPLLTFQNVKNNSTIDETPSDFRKCQEQVFVSRKKHFVLPKKRIPERTPRERETMKIVAGDRKKAKFWAVRRKGCPVGEMKKFKKTEHWKNNEQCATRQKSQKKEKNKKLPQN